MNHIIIIIPSRFFFNVSIFQFLSHSAVSTLFPSERARRNGRRAAQARLNFMHGHALCM